MTRRRRLMVAAGIAATVFATLGILGTASAAWNGAATVNGSVSAGTAQLTADNFNTLTSTLQYPGPLSSVSAVTIKNTGTLALSGFTSSTSVPTSGAQHALAAAITVQIWPNASGGTCPATVPAGVTASSGTWASMPTWLASQQALAPAASASYCIASAIPSGTAQGTTSDTSFAPAVTVTATKSSWSTGAVSAAPFTLTVLSPQTVTSAQGAITPTNPADTGVGNVSILNGNSNVNTAPSDIDPYGTIDNTSYFCPLIPITVANDGKAHNWSIQIDMSKTPYNGAPLTENEWQSNGVQTAHIQSQSGSVYTIVGAATIDASHPLGSTSGQLLHNTPLSYPQTTQITFCITRSDNPGVYAAGNGTYSTATPKLVNCGNVSQPAPNFDNACAYLVLTGLYPHFYVGWTYPMDWTSLINSGPFTDSQKTSLLAKTDLHNYSWTASATGPSVNGNMSNTALNYTRCGPGTTACASPQNNGDTWFNISGNGYSASTNGITNGQVDTILIPLAGL